MEDKNIKTWYFEEAKKYIDRLSDHEKISLMNDIGDMKAGRVAEVYTKKLQGPVREIIFGHHRITYFQIDSTIYFVRGFRKKTTKTPRQEIGYAQKMYKLIEKYNEKNKDK